VAKLRLKLVFPPQFIRQPVIHDLGKQSGVVTNILCADVEIDKGCEEIDLAASWLLARGIDIELVDSSPSV